MTYYRIKREAIEQARKADEHYRRTGKLLGPLHGLPVSLKDCFDLTGTDSTLGIGSRACHPSRKCFFLNVADNGRI